jgi:hypothetical protein
LGDGSPRYIGGRYLSILIRLEQVHWMMILIRIDDPACAPTEPIQTAFVAEYVALVSVARLEW